ncbi:unnamed protein product [Chrysoparadoxa australica]
MTRPVKPVRASLRSTRASCDLFQLVPKTKDAEGCGKSIINMTLGDPCAYGYHSAPHALGLAACQAASDRSTYGYGTPPSPMGCVGLRKLLSQKYSSPTASLEVGDVVVCSGCTGALSVCFQTLILEEEGSHVILPNPCFPLYESLAHAAGGDVKYSRMKGSEMDFEHMESLIDNKTVAIVLTNPTMPGGLVFSREHLQDLLQMAKRHHLPVISDEIYGGMVLSSSPKAFTPLASVAGEDQSPDATPVLTCTGLGKEYCIPGWRLGWITITDPAGALSEIRKGIQNLSFTTFGPNRLAQQAILNMLMNHQTRLELESYKNKYLHVLDMNARLVINAINTAEGLFIPHEPEAGMFILVALDPEKITLSEVSFTHQLAETEGLLVSPGCCFARPPFKGSESATQGDASASTGEETEGEPAPKMVRLVLAVPTEMMEDVVSRLIRFAQSVLVTAAATDSPCLVNEVNSSPALRLIVPRFQPLFLLDKHKLTGSVMK